MVFDILGALSPVSISIVTNCVCPMSSLLSENTLGLI